MEDSPIPVGGAFSPELMRRMAYQNESDPLFFKEQAGEVEVGTWAAKREEIKERYPYPEDQARAVTGYTGELPPESQ